MSYALIQIFVIVSENGAYPFNYLLIGCCFDDIMTKYVTWGWIGAGVPYGLQNRYEELIPSRVGSIPTHSRQRLTVTARVTVFLFLNRDFFVTFCRVFHNIVKGICNISP